MGRACRRSAAGRFCRTVRFCPHFRFPVPHPGKRVMLPRVNMPAHSLTKRPDDRLPGNYREPPTRKAAALVRAVREAAAGKSPSGALARIIAELRSKWDVPNLFDAVSFSINPRLRTAVARWVIDAERIEFGPRFFSASVNHVEVLCHELAHVAAVLKHGGRIRPHGAEWRELVRMAGLEPRTRLPKPSSTHRELRKLHRLPQRYEHRCSVCQSVWYARRPVRAWRCGECAAAGLPGTLQISRSEAGRTRR